MLWYTRSGPAKPPKVTRVRTHPTRPEAVTMLPGGGLARWALDDPPRLLTQIQTDLHDIDDIMISSDGALVALAGSKSG